MGKRDCKTHLTANPARMLSETANDAMAGLDRTLGEQRVPAFGADGVSFFLHFFIDETKGFERGYAGERFQFRPVPNRAAIRGVDLKTGALADHHTVVGLFQVSVQ